MRKYKLRTLISRETQLSLGGIKRYRVTIEFGNEIENRKLKLKSGSWKFKLKFGTENWNSKLNIEIWIETLNLKIDKENRNSKLDKN